MEKLSLEKVLKALRKLGFENIEAQVYVYLAKKGPLEIKELENAMKLTPHQLYPALESLLSKRIVSKIPEYSFKYSAMPIEEVLDMFLKEKKHQAEALQTSREELILSWQSSYEANSGEG